MISRWMIAVGFACVMPIVQQDMGSAQTLPDPPITVPPADRNQLNLAQQRRQYQTQGVIFEAPPGFSEVQPLGGQTVGIVFPATALQTRRVAVRLAAIKVASPAFASFSPAELSDYVRYSYFGMNGTPQSHRTRRFVGLGQEIAGDVFMLSSNGGMTYLELYMLPLSMQRQVAIAFEADTELPVYLLEQTIQTVTDSLREIPNSKHKH
ncbi:MAG: hypothetical protein WCD18_17860 [Thermosynechococcaceae cyanobacterium]